MRITEILDKNCIRVPLSATDKAGAITELIDGLAEAGKLTNRDEVIRAILAREQTRSTGIGQGLAVPHGKSNGCAQLVMAIGRPEQPIDFDSTDGKPCELIVLLTSPVDKTGPHIQALASVSRLWLNEEFRREVLNAQSAEEMYAAIERLQGP
jgi:fructose-specific phosphotransferase system IIA component